MSDRIVQIQYVQNTEKSTVKKRKQTEQDTTPEISQDTPPRL